MTASAWKLTYDPAGAATVLLNYGDMLESDELEPQLDKSVEVVELIDAPAPFLRIRKNAVITFSIRVLVTAGSDAAARAAMLDSLVAAQTATKKPLKVEVEGITDAYWQFASATVKTHRPRRAANWPEAGNWKQWDLICTGFTKTTVP